MKKIANESRFFTWIYKYDFNVIVMNYGAKLFPMKKSKNNNNRKQLRSKHFTKSFSGTKIWIFFTHIS